MTPQPSGAGYGGLACKGLIVAVVLCGIAMLEVSLINRRYTSGARPDPASCSSTILNSLKAPENKNGTKNYTSSVEERKAYYRSKIWHPGRADDEKCTLIVETYKREKLLMEVLSHYCSERSIVSRIVVIWNDPETPVPSTLYQAKCSKQLKVVTAKQNKMTNRFLLQNLDANDTNDCIFLVDDDVITSWDDLSFGFSVWKAFRDQIVGYDGRTRLYTILKDGSYFYGVVNKPDNILTPKGGHATMLPGFFVHRAYLEMMFDPEMVAPELLSVVDEVMNCDDILFSMMVTRFLRDANMGWSAGLAVKPKQAIKVLNPKGGFQGLSARGNHYTVRSTCLNKFVQFLGKDSLTLSQLTISH